MGFVYFKKQRTYQGRGGGRSGAFEKFKPAEHIDFGTPSLVIKPSCCPSTYITVRHFPLTHQIRQLITVYKRALLILSH